MHACRSRRLLSLKFISTQPVFSFLPCHLSIYPCYLRLHHKHDWGQWGALLSLCCHQIPPLAPVREGSVTGSSCFSNGKKNKYRKIAIQPLNYKNTYRDKKGWFFLNFQNRINTIWCHSWIVRLFDNSWLSHSHHPSSCKFMCNL